MWDRFSKSALLLLLIAAPAAGQTLTFARATVLPITMQIAPTNVSTPTLSGTGLVWRGRVAHGATVSSLRVHVVVSGPATGWQLVVRSELTGAVVETYDSTSGWVRAGDFWTREVQGSAALLDVNASADVSKLIVTIDKYAYDETPLRKQSIFGVDGRLPVVDASSRIRDLGKSVARLRIMIAGLGQATCTGFAISDSLVFTNEHCVSTLDDARSTLVDWGYDGPSATVESVRVDDLAAVSHEFDYALLHLEKPLAAKWPPLKLATADAKDGEDLIVIEHPLGGFKQVSLESCDVAGIQLTGVTPNKTDFGHRCDTLNGSSGSPVISDATGDVIGLHHFGFDTASRTYVNRAVAIRLIVNDIKQTRPKLIAQ